MLILYDHGTPAPLAFFLTDHTVRKAKDLGWHTLTNGEIMQVAEEAGFEILITTDKNIRYQQNLTGRKIAILLASTRYMVVASLRCTLGHLVVSPKRRIPNFGAGESSRLHTKSYCHIGGRVEFETCVNACWQCDPCAPRKSALPIRRDSSAKISPVN